MQRLWILVERCECTELTVQQHKDILFSDGFVSGLKSDALQDRLLDLVELEASPEKSLSLTNTIEVFAAFFHSINSSSDSTPSSAPVGNTAAVSRRTAQPY